MPTSEFLINMGFLLAGAILFLTAALALQQYYAAKDNNWPHPLIKTPTGLHVAGNDDKVQSFSIIKENITYSRTEEHLRSVYNMIEQFKLRFGLGKEYDELLSAYCAKSPMITG